MAKLNSYSKEEQKAVFKQTFGDTPIKFGDLTPTQRENMMNTFAGSVLVLKMRFRKFWHEVKVAAERNRK